MEKNNGDSVRLNMEVLDFVNSGILANKTHLYKPEDLDIDLRNLESEGYITYGGDVNGVAITESGRKALDVIYALMENRMTDGEVEQMLDEMGKE